MANLQEGWVIFADPDNKGKLRLELRRFGYGDNGEKVNDVLIAVLDQRRVDNALRSCKILCVEALRWDMPISVFATGKDDKLYEMCLEPAALARARELQNQPCKRCQRFDCQCRVNYPQGWIHVPGDMCEHGNYIDRGGVICDQCHSGTGGC